MKCQQCKEQEATHELAESYCCLDCWQMYWDDEGIKYDESWNDFEKYTLTKIEDETKTTERTPTVKS